MKFLVDANVLCEPTKPQCVQKAVDWFQANVVECVTDAVVMGEIWRGIDKAAGGTQTGEFGRVVRRPASSGALPGLVA